MDISPGCLFLQEAAKTHRQELFTEEQLSEIVSFVSSSLAMESLVEVKQFLRESLRPPVSQSVLRQVLDALYDHCEEIGAKLQDLRVADAARQHYSSSG